MMIPTLDFSSLQVRDLDASRQFYTQVLGFAEAATKRPGAVIFENEGGAIFALVAARMDLDAAPYCRATRPPLVRVLLGAGVSLWFTSHDVAALHDHAKASEAKVLQAPQNGPFGRMTVVADPDGYALTFHEPPQEG